MKAFAAQFKDLFGPTNPTGILSPAFLRLKLALDHGDAPDNVLQALYDWLGQRKISPERVDAVLDLPSAEHACEALVSLVGAGFKPGALPPLVKQTLQRAIREVARRQVARRQSDLDVAKARMERIGAKFAGEDARAVVDRKLS
jgi:hypothetical protein